MNPFLSHLCVCNFVFLVSAYSSVIRRSALVSASLWTMVCTDRFTEIIYDAAECVSLSSKQRERRFWRCIRPQADYNKYQVTQMDSRDALPYMHRAVGLHKRGRSV